MSKTKVLVVDDSIVIKQILKDMLERSNTSEVVGFGKNGKEAVSLVKQLDPDVVLLDMVMGDFDGIYAVEHIMNEKPTPIILLSALENTDDSDIFRALKLGAVDYIGKPRDHQTKLSDLEHILIEKIEVAKSAKMNSDTSFSSNLNPHTFSTEKNYEILVIGASTGGPTAIENVLVNLPSNFNMPIVIAQHMPENFVDSFVNRLDKLLPFKVLKGQKGDVLTAGKIYIAPGNQNMIVKSTGNKIIIDYSDEYFPEFNHPSVNALMLSVAEVYCEKAIAVILTGMGRDGMRGIEKIKNNKGLTIAQSEETCVVFGMPKEAIKTGKIDYIVPIKEIGGFIVSALE